jgi:phosphatidylglycerophosphate synthase
MKNIKYIEIRRIQYKYDREMAKRGGVDIDQWSKSPYTCFKTRYYIEFSSVLLYLLRRVKIHPSDITLIYALSGIVIIPLFASRVATLIYIALFIAFSKGILDWADGTLARITNQTSNQGHILDSWGAYVNALGLRIGIALYIYNTTNDIIYLYLIVIIAFFRATNLKNYANATMFLKQKDDNLSNYKKDEIIHKNEASFVSKIYNYFFSIFDDDRARSVDFLCLLLIIELNSSFFVSNYFFVFMVLQEFIKWIGYIYQIRFKNIYNNY